MRFYIYLIGSLICFMLVNINSAHSQIPSAFDFMKPSTNRDMALSPSGRYVAFSETVTDKFCLNKYGQIASDDKSCKTKHKEFGTTYKIKVYDLQENKIARIADTPKSYYVGWLEFASDERLLASIGQRTTIGRSGRSWAIGQSRIFAMDVNAPDTAESDLVVLFDDQKSVQRSNRSLTRVTNFLKKDPDHIIMPARKGGELDLWKVNVNDGSADRIAVGKPGTFYWYTDGDGKPIFRYDCSSNCRKIKIYAPGDQPDSWEKIREFKTKPDEELEEFQFYPVATTDIDSQFYVLSDEDENAKRSVKIFDLKTKSYVRTVYEHPTMDVSGVVTSVETDDYMGVWLYEDRLKYVLNDKRLQKHYDALNKYFDDESNVSLLGFDSSGSKAIVYVSAHNTPGGYFIYNFDARNIDKLISTEPELEGLNSDGRVMKIAMRDGTKITAYHFHPKNQQDSAPLLVMPHGGPHVRDTFGFDYWAQYFVARGYQVVQMNFRGSDGYGRAFEEAGYGEWGGLMQDDITDTVKYFHSSGLATPDKTCIVGYSFGGYAALYGGATTPELYKCIVSGGGVADLGRMMKDDKGNLNEETYEFLKQSVGDPKTEKDKLEARSPVNLADKFQAPVLLIHGEYDRRVDMKHSEKMKKALEKAGKSVEFLELEEAGHNGWGLDTDILYLTTIEAFLKRHIGP